MDTSTLDSIAAQVRAAQDGAQPLQRLTLQHPGFDLDAAYAVALRMHEARLAAGDRPVGRKIGFTNAAIWPEYGVHHPIWGPVYARTLVRVPPAGLRFALSHLHEPRIEPEIALCLRDVPQPGMSADALLACLDWIAPVFEIVQSHFPGWKFAAADTVADGGLHGALLMGEPVPAARIGTGGAKALAELEIALHRDDQPVEVGRGSNVLGSPLLALEHLARVLATQPAQPPLRAGEIITTGTVTAAYPIAPGQRWRSEPRGLGLAPVSVEFIA